MIAIKTPFTWGYIYVFTGTMRKEKENDREHVECSTKRKFEGRRTPGAGPPGIVRKYFKYKGSMTDN